jgi:hypothetical protein
MATIPRYPKVSTQNLVRTPGFDFDVPSPLSQAVGRRMAEQQAAEAKQADMKLSPLDKAVSAMKATASMGTMLFQAIQQAPKALQGEDAYTEAIGNTAYIPQDPKALEYMGDFGNMLEKLETEYKIPNLMPELVPFQPLAGLARTQANQAVERGATRAGMALERSLDKPVTDIMNRGGLGAQMLGSFNTRPAQVVKPKGGNWLTGDVEKQLGRMKMSDQTTPEQMTEMQNSIDAAKRIMGDDPTVQRTINQMENELSVAKRNNAINSWIDSNLTNYVKKQMSTPEDPVRKLAEEDILHIQPYGDQQAVSSRLIGKRIGAGFDPLGAGKSDAARFWERQADISIDPYPAGSYKHGALDEKLLEANPWLQNVPDDQMVNSAKGLNDLGFDHIIDVLRQDVREGRIRPEQLNKVSMEQAVRRTYEFDQEQARKMAEAQAKVTEGMPVHKEYPEGYKWVELAPKEVKSKGDLDDLGLQAYFDYMKSGGDEAYALKAGQKADAQKYLAEALKYEGDTMGHCVGGYCPDVLEGRSRIYSLRDKRGEPHVTIEVQPMRGSELGRYAADLPEGEDVAAMKNPPQSIRQIKGKQNAAPKEDYLPYVQDFVRSGEWSDVGDLKNTGLVRQDNKYMTQSEYDDYLLNQLQPPAEGMKRGGKVHISDNPDSMMMDMEDQKFQVGGIVDVAARAAKAAKAAQMKQAMKASEALAKIEGKRLNVTQADRTKVGQGYLGGPGFSGLQLQEGPHKDVGAVWGVKNTGTAKTIVGGFDKPLGKEYFTTMIGSPTQHQSNQMVFDKLYGDFKKEAKKGNLDPELKDKINARLAAAVDKDGNPIFPPDVDILDKDFKKIVNTFDRRAVTGNLLGGVGVGGKKGQIIDYDKVIRDTTDPFLLDAPSGSMGYRLWTPSGEIIERPDLHPAFPAILTGEDLGVEFSPAAQDILMAPWVENVRQTKGRNPGYMDWTRGRPPSVEVTDKLLRNLEESGNKKGGLIKVKRKAGGGIIKKAIKAAGKAVESPAVQRLEMSFKDVTKPVTELTEGAQKLKAGQLSREEYEALVNKHKPVTPYSFVPQPATAEDATRALNSSKREKYGKTKDIPAGTPAGLRLDIPAYKDHGVWVNSVHPEDMPTMYSNVSSVRDAEMVMPEEKALEVATREKGKSPFAVIKGGWNPMTEEEAVAKAQEYLNHPEWVQVGIDPERHGYYYNRATMEPIVRAEEVIQIGPLVLAKKPITAPKESFRYARGGAINADDLILTERPL